MKDVINESKNLRCPVVAKSKAQERTQEFLAEASQFKLGNLPTESRHPKTMRLSQLAKSDLPQAIEIFNEVDREAVSCLSLVKDELTELTRTIRETLSTGGRIFLCGCGATGRLSVSLEALWREEVLRIGRSDLSEKVFSFIAGGDFALVRSIENFEDHPEYGVRQLKDLGFKSGDLLLAITEGGETPFVIGAAEEAAQIQGRKPYFIFCNPPDLLCKTAERSKNVIQSPLIKKIYLAAGPMVLSGSTRLQATTVQQLAVGACLFACLENEGTPFYFIDEMKTALIQANFRDLAPLIESEALVYQKGEICVHRTDRFGVTVLTDTTERTPTFSLLPFESNLEIGREPSWTYLNVLGTTSADSAWKKVLGRSPRSLDWSEYSQQFGLTATLAYDFSEQGLKRRQTSGSVHIFDISDHHGALQFSFGKHAIQFFMPKSLLVQHLLVKCALNMTSTLLMGRLGRFLGNVMVYVRPTNKKLVDRSIRYIQLLLQDEGITKYSYGEICQALFEEFEGAKEDIPIVVRTFERLKDQAVSLN